MNFTLELQLLALDKDKINQGTLLLLKSNSLALPFCRKLLSPLAAEGPSEHMSRAHLG